MLSDLDCSLVLSVYRYALGCVRRDRAVCRRWRQILPTCRRIALSDVESIPHDVEQAMRRATEWDRVLKLAIDGAAAIPAALRVLDARLDRIVSLQVGKAAAGGSCLWPEERGKEKEMLLKNLVRECSALEELDLVAIGLTEFDAQTLADALLGSPMIADGTVLRSTVAIATDGVRDRGELHAPLGDSDDRTLDKADSELDVLGGLAPLLADSYANLGWKSCDRRREEETKSRRKAPILLTGLRLEKNGMDRFGMKLLAQPIAQCHSLTRLNLNGNRIGLDGAAALARAIIQGPAPTLRELQIANNDLGPEGMGALEGALLSLHELRLLDLNGNRLTARGATNLAEGLRLCSTLTTLALNFNFLGAEGAQSMTPVFSAQHALTDLDLSFNDMGPAGVRALVQGLAPEEEGDRIQLALVHLDLSKNTLGARGAAELFPLLRRCATTVETVSLRCNGLGQQYAAMVNCQVPRATVHVLEEY